MTDIRRLPDSFEIRCEGENSDASLRFESLEDRLKVYITAGDSRPQFIALRWNCFTGENTRVLGDVWERSYADLGWRGLSSRRFMPWYFMLNDGETTSCCGVMTGCRSFVSFECGRNGVTAWMDVRCGAAGVQLGGRELEAASFVCAEYAGIPAFEAARRFCRIMCPAPLMPEAPVYGGNNWYYAGGRSSAEDIVSDARLQARLSEGLSNRPFMVADDGWQPNPKSGPWLPNGRFGDMRALAGRIKELDVRPGLWIRPLGDEDGSLGPELRIERGGERRVLDPSLPEVLEHISESVERIRSWGYELLKHDVTTFDMFGDRGRSLNGAITIKPDWSFADRSRTGAEIATGLYACIKKAAGDMTVIGCNTIPHLCAGLVEINRTGADISGSDWGRTRDFGVNTLAFRLPQHGAFYACDADCVGIMERKIPWELNRQWLELLSLSGTPLFVSCPEGLPDAEQLRDLRAAYERASEQKNTAVPLDWMYSDIPSRWLIDGKERVFDWSCGRIPELVI